MSAGLQACMYWDTPVQLIVMLSLPRLSFIPSTWDAISFGAPHSETQRVYIREATGTGGLYLCVFRDMIT